MCGWAAGQSDAARRTSPRRDSADGRFTCGQQSLGSDVTYGQVLVRRPRDKGASRRPTAWPASITAEPRKDTLVPPVNVRFGTNWSPTENMGIRKGVWGSCLQWLHDSPLYNIIVSGETILGAENSERKNLWPARAQPRTPLESSEHLKPCNWWGGVAAPPQEPHPCSRGLRSFDLGPNENSWTRPWQRIIIIIIIIIIIRCITVITQDIRETVFLFQRLSIALQRGNVVSFLNTMNTE